MLENPSGDVTPVILDIGTGNGVQITHMINRLAKDGIVRRLRLILLDQFDTMLEAAKEYIQKNSIIPVDIECIVSKIQYISETNLNQILKHKPIWFVNAAASIHHMPDTEKLSVLKMFKEISDLCLLSEFHANHDLTEDDSPELFYSVTEFYGYYVKIY